MSGSRFLFCFAVALSLSVPAAAGLPSGSSVPRPWGEKFLNARQLCETGNFAQAADAYTALINAMKAVDAPMELIARAHDELAISLKVAGRLDEAEKNFLRSLDLMQRADGAVSERVGVILSDVGAFYVEIGQLARAEHYLLEARNALNVSAAAPAFVRAAILQDLGALYYRQQQFANSEIQFRGALQLLRTAGPKERPQVAVVLGDLTQVLVALGRRDDALPFLREALSIFESLPGKYQSNHYAVLVISANLQRSLGDLEGAGKTCDGALPMGEHVLGTDNPRLIGGLDVCSAVYKAEHRRKESKQLASRSLAIRTELATHSAAGKTVDLATLSREAAH